MVKKWAFQGYRCVTFVTLNPWHLKILLSARQAYRESRALRAQRIEVREVRLANSSFAVTNGTETARKVSVRYDQAALKQNS